MRSLLGTHRVGRVAAIAAAAMMLDALVDLLPRQSIGVVLGQSEPATPETVAPETIEQDRLLIEGYWRVVSIEVNGTTNSSDDVRKITTENHRDGTLVAGRLLDRLLGRLLGLRPALAGVGRGIMRRIGRGQLGVDGL
jgi:hypothetical protein